MGYSRTVKISHYYRLIL